MADETIKWQSGCKEIPEEGRLNIIVKGENVTEDIDYGDRIIIDMPRALEHAHQIELDTMPLHEDTIMYTNMIFPDVTEDNWIDEGMGVHHVLGRVDLSLKLGDVSTFMWRNPEDSLHPPLHVEIAKLILIMLKGYPMPSKDDGQTYADKHHTLDITTKEDVF